MSTNFPERFGRYTLLQHVASGGMAEILLAVEDSAHEGKRFVTIKRIRREYAEDPDFIEFFISEGRVSMKCSHPNLLKSIDLDAVGDTHYLAMEYFRGHTVLDLIRAAHCKNQLLSIGTALRIARDVTAALQHLHGMCDEAGKPLKVVHRDVTPQNVMINATGAVKLIDLGIARSELQTHKTKTGTVKGKLSYLAPEQLLAEPQVPEQIANHRVDLFAVGILMFEALTNRALFRGDSDADTLRRIRGMKVPAISSIRDDATAKIDDIVARALERNPNERYQSASELLLDLDSLKESQGGPARTDYLRDEVLALCGDPPVPTLGSESFGALQNTLRSASSANDDDAKGQSIEYFVERCAISGGDE